MGKGRAARDRYYNNFKKIGIKIPWEDFIYILIRYYGFETYKKTGSSARVFTKEGITFVAYEPHGKRRGNKFAHLSDRKRAINAIKRLETLKEEKDK